MRVAARYLFRTHAGLCRFAPGAPQTWMPLARADIELSTRINVLIAEGPL